MIRTEHFLSALILFLFSCSSDSQYTLRSPLDSSILVIKQSSLESHIWLKLDSLDIDFQIRGHCYAFSSKKNAKESNGEAHSDNVAKPIDKDFLRNGLYLFLNDKELVNIQDRIVGHKLYLVNSTGGKVDFEAQDSRLNITAQAQDSNKNWKTISYLPSSWCGNSYHEITLDKDEYWEFEVPVFKGKRKTKLRYLLKMENKEIYSNEINAFLNDNQFITDRKEGHTPQDIMDPYNE